MFGEGNEFCKKITYKIGKKTAEDTISEFRTSPLLRIAVTVDMIATGTDIKPLECLIFLRDVRSQAYYEQMKGRGTRVIGIDELHKVTPDAIAKTRFVLIDAVGVTETDKTETRSLESKPYVSTEKLMEQIARGERGADTLRSLGNRLLRLDIKLNDEQRKQITAITNKPLALIAGELIKATNEDTIEKLAEAQFNTENPTEQQRQQVYTQQAEAVVKPFHNPDLREKIAALQRDTEQIIDDSADELQAAGYDKERAENLIKSFQQFINDHQNELTAIQLLYNQPYQQRHLSYQQIEKLAEEIKQPPYNIAPVELWKAYEQLEKARVKGEPLNLLTNIISLIRFATGLVDILEPFPELVERRFKTWLQQQEQAGREFAPDQLDWLEKIKTQIANNAEMSEDDFEYTPFKKDGGILKARQLFGQELKLLIAELNGYLVA